MSQTSVRKLDAGRAARVAQLRAYMRTMEAAPSVVEHDVIHAFPELDKLLPAGGLLRKQVVGCTECPAFVAELISKLSKRGRHVGVVGWPDLGFVHINDKGDLSRVVAVPDPGVDPWAVTATLAEGLDVVIHHGPPGEVAPSHARSTWAKLRRGNAAVLSVGSRLPGTTTTIAATVDTYRGIGCGSGRITGMDIAVTVESKGHRQARGVLTSGQPRRLAAV